MIRNIKALTASSFIAMFFLGVANTELGIRGMPHAPDFSVDEEAIIVGTKVMANIVIDYLQRNSLNP